MNGTTRTLSETGFLFEQIGVTPVNLVPGQSANYSFNYSVSVQESGLPVAFDPKGSGLLIHLPTTCGDAYTGIEYAKAYLIVLAEDPRVVHNPVVITQGLRHHHARYAWRLVCRIGDAVGDVDETHRRQGRSGREHLHQPVPDLSGALGAGQSEPRTRDLCFDARGPRRGRPPQQ